jgi:hypothetical protein
LDFETKERRFATAELIDGAYKAPLLDACDREGARPSNLELPAREK